MANSTTISMLFAVLFAVFIFDFFFLGLIAANEVDKQQRQKASVLAENGTAPADIAKLEPATTEANNNSSSIPRVEEGEEEEGNENQQGREQKGLGRILVTLTPVGKSHLRSMMPLINRLTSAGHQVHLLHITNEPDVPPLPNNPNVTIIKMPIEVERGGSDLFGVVWTRTMHSPTLALAVHSMSKTSELAIINNSDKLAQVLNAEWDLLLTSELFNPHGYGLSLELHEKSRVPVLSFCSTRLVTSHAYQIALGQNWVIHLSMFAPGPSNPKEGFEPRNYIHRLTNVLEGVGELAAAVYIDKFVLAPKVALFTGKADFSSAQLHAHNEMVLADSIAYLGHPQSEASEVLNIGAHCEPASELPEDYRNFVEDPKSKGTIYVAFGTWVPWDFAPPSLVNAFFDAFDRLPDYRFVFSFNGKNPVGRKLSAHIRLVAWAPQMDVLSHPKTRVFLTHCGLKSIKESLCSKTPMLGMPIFAEQNYNSRIMINFGMGIALNKFHIDAEQLYAGLRELLENAKYAERVGKMQQMFLDRPMAALDAGEFYVRKIIKKGKDRLGRHHFKRAGIDMLAISYFNLDLLSCILLVVFALAKY